MKPDGRKKAPQRYSSSDKSGRLKVWGIVAASFLLVLMGGLAAYAYFLPPQEDPAFADMRATEKQIEALEKSDNPQPDDALIIAALHDVLDEQWKAIPQEKKDQKFDERMDKDESQRDEWAQPRLAAFFALPPEERNAAISKAIDESEARRSNWERNGEGPPGERGGPAGEGGGRPGGNRGPRGGGPGRGSWVSKSAPSAERQKSRVRNQLNRTTADYRAQRTEFVRLVQEQRKEKGLPPVPVRTAIRMFPQVAPPPAPSPTS